MYDVIGFFYERTQCMLPPARRIAGAKSTLYLCHIL
jgi:hypothetical protein